MWGKAVAVTAVLAALAATNLHAAAKERRESRVASDVVTAMVVVTADVSTLRPGTVVLTVSLSNSGPPLQIHRPRMQSPGYSLEPVGPLPQRVGTGKTVLLTVRLRGSCGSQSEVPPRLVVPVVPASGRVRDVTAAVSPDLAELVCGRRPLTESTGLAVVDVRIEAAAVTFVLRLSNRSRDVLAVNGLAAEGLRLTVTTPTPTPVAVAAGASVEVPVRLTVASCTHLPTPLDAQRIDTLPFAAFELSLSASGTPKDVVPYLTDGSSPLYSAVRALAHRACPAAGT